MCRITSSNVRVVEEVFDYVAAGDADAVVERLDPDVVWKPTAFLTGAAEYRGHAGVREWIGQLHDLAATGSDVLTFANRYEDLGDGRVLVLGDGAIVREAGPLRQRLGWIWELGEDGRVTAMTNYLDPDEARRVAADGRP